MIGEPPRFNSPQTVNVFTYETDVNGDRNNLVIPCEITDKSKSELNLVQRRCGGPH